ncbi:MAG: hypothetical protein V4506_05225 [Bacteroidota bacterium]
MLNRKDSLLSPGFLIGLLVLILNDFYFKYHFHNALTGKLSDVAGLFIFPLFISALLKSHSKSIFFAVAVFFIYWKSPFSDGLLNFFSGISGFQFERVVDYTDLFCLPVLIVAYKYQMSNYRQVYFSRTVILCCSAFAFMATSKKKEAYIEGRYLLTQGYEAIVPRAPYLINLNRAQSSVGYNDSLLRFQNFDDTIIVSLKSTITDMYPSVFVLKDLKNENAQLLKIFIYDSKELNERIWFDRLNTEISKRHLIFKRREEYLAKMDSLIMLTLKYHKDVYHDDELFLIDTVLTYATPAMISERQLYELKADILIDHYDSTYKKEILKLFDQQDEIDKKFNRSYNSVNRYSKRLDFLDFVKKDSLKYIYNKNNKKSR